MVHLTSAGKEELDRLTAQADQDPNMPGFIFGVTTAQEEIYFQEGGYKVLNDPSSGKITPESVFWICSQTKLLTHLAALQLIERGQLHRDDQVSDYLPQFTDLIVLDDVMKENPSYKPAKEVVRIKHLLSFTSGLSYPWKDINPERQISQYSSPHSKEDPIEEFFRLVKGPLPGIPLQFEPGSNFGYGFSSDVLGFVVEKVAGVTLEEYFKKNILDPLRMKNTSFHLTPKLLKDKVPLNIRKDGKLQLFDPEVRLFETDPEKVHLRLGGVGLYSTARDYLSLLRHLLQIHDGTATDAVFSKETVSSIFTPALDERGAQTATGFISLIGGDSPWKGAQWSTALALNTQDWPGKRRKYSGYWGGWANTHHYIDPTTGIAAVFQLQVIPTLDKDVMEYAAKFEAGLYGGLDMASTA